MTEIPHTEQGDSHEGNVVPIAFFGSRGEAQDAIYSLGCRLCAYSSGDQWNRCDCKFGIRASTRPLSEQTGCPELRSLYWVVATMTDEEWAALRTRYFEEHC